MNSLNLLFGAFQKPADSAPPSETQTNKESKKRHFPKEDTSEPKQKKQSLENEGGIKKSEADIDESYQLKKARLMSISNLGSIQIKIHTVEALEYCLHEVALPPHVEYKPLIKPKKLLKEYKFILDPFQKEAIMCIENNESVLVSAHTSSGKTVVGEYSIIKSLNLKQRVIYTTPIKALSNQKYREFQEEFKDVGLITGDVTINPTAGCLIMTTEILRNMLYRGSEVMREVSWVIFDEIHYMRDKERGVVWEETLILLPDNVHYVFLSATIPNARQFAEWVAHIHSQPCHVVYTDYRPTPLQHFVFPVGGDCTHLIVDEKSVFNERNFELASKIVQDPGQGKKFENKKLNRRSDGKESSCLKLIRMIMEKNLAPALIFSFSKKDCEIYAMQVAKLDFNTTEEKQLVDEIFQNAMDVLSEEDRCLPQVENVLPLLRRGIGIHHGGLLPILKETIEVLFSEGLIKALFATETFAMGLNMPAKSVIFTGIKKFDGRNHRHITSGEYIQMSGRAGRRGLDDNGTVIVMLDEPLSTEEGKSLMQGKADPLNSAFHLSYNMLLNLIRVDDINPEYLLERSFFQFQNHTNLPILRKQHDEIEEQISKIVIENEKVVESYFVLKKELNGLYAEYQTFIHKPEYLLPFLRPGRLVKACGRDRAEFGWGMVLSHRRANQKNSNPFKVDKNILIDVLLLIDPKSTEENPKPCPKNDVGKMVVISLTHQSIMDLSTVCVVLPKDLRSADNQASAQMAYREVEERFKGDFPILDPLKNMNIEDTRFTFLVDKIAALKKRLEVHVANKTPDFEKVLETFEKKEELRESLENVANEIDKSMSLLQMEELRCRKRVLRRLEFSTESDVIELKGRVACEISCADELLLTEMLLSGTFNDLTPQQSAALLSCFVCEEKSNTHAKLSEELAKPFREAKELARKIIKVSKEAKMEINEDTYLDQMKPFLMDPVYSWCNGATFHEICKQTEIFEGSIIRCMRRLEELLRQLMQAAKTLGNQDLEVKFSMAITMIKRDIVFAASLYL